MGRIPAIDIFQTLRKEDAVRSKHEPNYQGSYIHDLGSAIEGVMRVPETVAHAMLLAAYPALEQPVRFDNKCYTVVGMKSYYGELLVLYLADFVWYLYKVPRAVIEQRLEDYLSTGPEALRAEIREIKKIPEELPLY
jgi:hypothetical protein